MFLNYIWLRRILFIDLTEEEIEGETDQINLLLIKFTLWNKLFRSQFYSFSVKLFYEDSALFYVNSIFAIEYSVDIQLTDYSMFLLFFSLFFNKLSLFLNSLLSTFRREWKIVKFNEPVFLFDERKI